MKRKLLAGVLLWGLAAVRQADAQGMDQNLAREVAAVRQELARSAVALRQYSWIETTEVSVKGDVKDTRTFQCRPSNTGGVIKTPIGGTKEMEKENMSSNRPIVRKKADMQDYIGRAVSRIQTYFPPKPEQIDHLLQTGQASLGQTRPGEWEVRFTNYFEDKDSMVFAYDPVSKKLLKATVSSTLGSPKDPVTMEAVFQPLPDGVNHLASATLNAKSKKIQVKTTHAQYQKVTP